MLNGQQVGRSEQAKNLRDLEFESSADVIMCANRLENKRSKDDKKNKKKNDRRKEKRKRREEEKKRRREEEMKRRRDEKTKR